MLPFQLSLLTPPAPFYGDDPSVLYVDFVTGQVWDGVGQVELTLDDIMVSSRAGNAWVPKADGTDQLIAANKLPVSDLGLQPWVTRANLLANPDAPATQNLTIVTSGSACNYVFWVRGTGSVAVAYVSGAAITTLPAGAATEGTWRWFRLPVGTTTISVTVTGSITFFQLEKMEVTGATVAYPSPAIHGQQTRNSESIRAKGPLLAAMKQAELTLYLEWQEPGLQSYPDSQGNRRFFRASDGSAVTVATALISSGNKPQASHTVGSALQFNTTITAEPVNGGLNGMYIVYKAGAYRVALAGVEMQPTNSGAMNMAGLTQVEMFGRDDTHVENFGAGLRRLVIYPRALEDARLVPFDPTPSVPPAMVTYDPVVTTGGDAGAVYTRNSWDGSLVTKLRATSARKIVTDPALQGVEPANSNVVQIKSGQLTWEGHKHYIAGFGGNLVLGGDTVTETTDVVIQYVHFLPGDGVTGRNPDDRDGFGFWSGKRVIFRHCVFAYSIDEAGGMFPEGTFETNTVLFEYCIFGPPLKNAVVGGSLAKPNEPLHNFGLLAGRRSVNVVVRFCLHACCRQRNPEAVVPFGHFYYNNICYNFSNIGIAFWGYQLLSDRLGATAAAVNNLFKAGPQSPPDWLERCQVLGRVDRDSGFFFSGNAGTDGVTFSSDTVLAGDRVFLRNGATKLSLVNSMPFVSPYTPMPAATASDRQALWNYVMDNVGVRDRDGSGNAIAGDSAASPFTLAVINGVKAGTLQEIVTPSDFVGFLYT